MDAARPSRLTAISPRTFPERPRSQGRPRRAASAAGSRTKPRTPGPDELVLLCRRELCPAGGPGLRGQRRHGAHPPRVEYTARRRQGLSFAISPARTGGLQRLLTQAPTTAANSTATQPSAPAAGRSGHGGPRRPGHLHQGRRLGGRRTEEDPVPREQCTRGTSTCCRKRSGEARRPAPTRFRSCAPLRGVGSTAIEPAVSQGFRVQPVEEQDDAGQPAGCRTTKSPEPEVPVPRPRGLAKSISDLVIA